METEEEYDVEEEKYDVRGRGGAEAEDGWIHWMDGLARRDEVDGLLDNNPPPPTFNMEMESHYQDVESGQPRPVERRTGNKRTFFGLLGIFLVTVAFVAIVWAVSGSASSDADDTPPTAPAERALWLMKRNILIDGHNDLPHQYRKRAENAVHPSPIDLTQEQDFPEDPTNLHTDIPKIQRGHLSGQFWSVYVDCAKNDRDAVRATMEQIDVMERIIDHHPDVFERAFTADAMEDAFARGKVASVYGIEGGHQIDSSMAALREFYRAGVRYMTLTHNCDTPWAKWWNSTAKEDGLSDWGVTLVREMNRIGMFVDLSHVSHAVMRDVLTLQDPPAPPVMFSHSNVYAICGKERNVPDDVLELVKENGGVVMINFVPHYLSEDCLENDAPEVGIDDLIKHIQHIKDLHGTVDYVGIGADYDGVTSLVSGLEDVGTYPKLITRLIEKGFTDDEITKIMGKNILRAMRAVEAYKAAHSKDPAGQDWISEDEDLGDCRTKD